MLSESPYIQETNMFRALAKTKLIQTRCQNIFKNHKPLINNVSVRLYNQDLPKFPVPSLHNTLEKFLVSSKPFLNQNELLETEKKIKEFLQSGSNGLKLQELLEEKAKNSDNWLADWWVHAAYLSYRDPVIIFSNPGQTFPLIDFYTENDRLHFASNIILGAIQYKSQIDGNLIPEEKMGSAPLDMQQYKKVFGTCRIPGETVDSLEYNTSSKHIAVVHNNQWFRVDVIDNNGNVISKNQLISNLQNILDLSKERNNDPVGILTSENRDRWGKAYKHLMSDPQNNASVRDIQTSIVVLCLDNAMDKQNENRQTMQSRQTIHGGGSKVNSGNRWFDKTIQFVIGKDGTSGLCYEHSPAEGGPVAVMTDYVFKYAQSDMGSKIPDNNFNTKPKQLKFNITPEVKTAIEAAKQHIDKLAANLDMYCFTFKHYGKEFIKTQKMSPDSYIQMGLQYAFFRIHQTAGGHYESAGLRKFIHGRTETIRSTAIESIEFAKTMLNKNASNTEKAAALKKAIAGHKKYTVDAINGNGCDRHLLGLKLMAMEKGIELPSLYNDAAYKRSTHMRISSSQVPVNCDGFMCYAPLVSDGYGACYNPRKNTMNFSCSSFREDPSTSAENFAKNLEQSFLDMQNVLSKTQQAKL